MENSFLYINDYEYDSYSCHGCGHCRGEYDDYCCRSQEYEGLRVEFQYKSFMSSATEGMSKIQAYCVDRLVSIYKLYESNNWDIEASRGYYGEEVDYIKMNDFQNFIVDYNYIQGSTNDAKLIEYILNKEYGIVNEVITDVNIITVDRKDIVVTENNKLGDTNYEINSEIPLGIYKEINSKYKMIDGRHRFSITKGETLSIISVL